MLSREPQAGFVLGFSTPGDRSRGSHVWLCVYFIPLIICSLSGVEVTEGLILQSFRSTEVGGLKDSIILLDKPLARIRVQAH